MEDSDICCLMIQFGGLDTRNYNWREYRRISDGDLLGCLEGSESRKPLKYWQDDMVIYKGAPKVM